MILHLVKSTQSLVGIAALALVGLVGCGSEAGPSTSTQQPGVASSDEGLIAEPVGVVTGTYHNGHVTFGPVESTVATPGVTPQNFGAPTQSLLSFMTAAGDGVGPLYTGTAPCSATQYCADVTMTNNTGRAMQNVYVEITDYFAITPATSHPSWAGPAVTLSSTYTSAFKNVSKIEASSYGDLASGLANTTTFKFEIDSSTDFSFHVQVLATFPKSQISGNIYSGQGVVNACTAPGHTGPDPTDDGEADFQLPFAHTANDLTYDKATIGSNGYFLPYVTGGAAPSLLSFSNGNNNQYLPFTTIPNGYYPFWDDLAYDAGNGVCTAVSGSAPNRVLTVTWSGAKIASNQPTIPKAFTAETVTYSLQLFEQTDSIFFWYNLPTTVTNLTRGGSASIGAVLTSGGSRVVSLVTFNAPNFLSTTASSYSEVVVYAQFNPVP